MDRVLQHFLSGLATVLLIRGLAALPRQKEKPNTVELPRWMLILGLAVGLPTLAASLFLLLRGERVGSIVCLCMALLSGSLVLAYCNCRIFYDKDGFTAKSFFGSAHRYTYGDVSSIQGRQKDIKLFVGKRTIRLDALAVGRDHFLTFSKKQYRKQHGGRSIPAVRPGSGVRGDLFRGNLENTEGFVFAYVVLPIIFLIVFSFSEDT